MSLNDVDKGSVNRVNPDLNVDDVLNSVKGRGTSETLVANPADTTGQLQAISKSLKEVKTDIFEFPVSAFATTALASLDHNLGFKPIVTAGITDTEEDITKPFPYLVLAAGVSNPIIVVAITIEEITNTQVVFKYQSDGSFPTENAIFYIRYYLLQSYADTTNG